MYCELFLLLAFLVRSCTAVVSIPFDSFLIFFPFPLPTRHSVFRPLYCIHEESERCVCGGDGGLA